MATQKYKINLAGTGNTCIQIISSTDSWDTSNPIVQFQSSVAISSVTNLYGATTPTYLDDGIIITSSDLTPNNKGQSITLRINDIDEIGGSDLTVTTALVMAQIASLFNQMAGISVTINGTPNVNISKYGGTSTTLGQKADTASIPVVIASDQSAVAVTPSLFGLGTQVANASYQIPTTASYTAKYAITDNATNLTWSNVNATAAGQGYITKIRFMTDNTAWASTNAAVLKIHLFHTAPTPLGNNAAYTLLYANNTKGIGTITLPTLTTEGSGSTASYALWTGALKYKLAAASTTIYGILEVDSFSGTMAANSNQNIYIEISTDNF